MVDTRLLLFFSFKALKEVTWGGRSVSCEAYVYEAAGIIDAFLKLKCIKGSKIF